MELDNLTDIEISALIKELKYFLKNPQIDIPMVGQYKQEEIVLDKLNNIEYKFKTYRGKLDTKYSIHIRFLDNNKHLIRLCINGSNHTNNDGIKVSGNHIHIYKFDGKEQTDYAYELDNFPFDKDDDLAESVSNFIKFVNIKENTI
ncbi:DUF6978 family protein [Pediococcus pentosaceus]|uniref:DUF6978 family protein n=1 Tax=Pediococcus pentosaceus TaxID=1255 RepID=UPI003D77CF2B